MSEKFSNQALTTLTAELAKGATTLTAASAARFPAEGDFRILIDSELLMVTAVEGTTFTVERGIEETTDIPHASGSTVTQVLTAGGLANKADLDEGALRESEIPSSVVLASQLPAIYAPRYGVSASNTGEENSEALAEAIAAAEEQSIGRILFPSGVIALKSGFLLNKSDDEGGTFQYIFEGDGRGTTLELDGELDWLFRLNCTESDEAASTTSNLTGRLVIRDLLIKAEEGGSTGLVRTITASVHMHNVRCFHLDYGVYQVSGYCDHHSFEKVRWQSESTEHGWLLYVANGNGDGHLFSACDLEASNAARILQSRGLAILNCIGGKFDLQRCYGVSVDAHHWEAYAPQEIESTAPAFKLKDCHIRFGPGYFETGSTQPAIEVDDELYDGTQLTIAGTSLGWLVGRPSGEPFRTAHVHIANANAQARFIFEFPRGFCSDYGYGIAYPMGVLVSSDVEGIQDAIDGAPELLNGHSILENKAAAWTLAPVSGVRTAKRWEYAPLIESVNAQLGIGGSITNGTEYFYQIAVWDGFQWSNASNPQSGKAVADKTAFHLAITVLSPCATVRVWRGLEKGSYNRYIDLTLPTEFTVLSDIGDYIAGLAWITEGIKPRPEENLQQDLVEQNGRIVGECEGEGEPKGAWPTGTRFYDPSPTSGGYMGIVAVSEGPTEWKAFGKIE